MATIGSSALSLIDWAKRFDPETGQTSVIAELLSNSNEVLQDMLWVEGNLPTGHKTTIRTGLPGVTWRLLNYGVQPTKSTTAQVTDTCGMLEAYSKVDRSLADLMGNTAQFRLSEAKSFVEAMSQEFATTLFYGNASLDPEKFTGLAPRYSTVTSSTLAQNAENVIDAGGTGSDNTSMWLIGWGENSIHGIFPKGSKAGLMHEDVTTAAPVTDAAGGLYQAYQDHWKWDCGLTTRDWRYAIRIANIDVSDLAGGSPANLARLMIRAMNKRPPGFAGARWSFYGNRAVKTWAEIQQVEKSNMGFHAINDGQGQSFVGFQGVPFKLCDALLNTEARVT